jgi:hypothetical protein
MLFQVATRVHRASSLDDGFKDTGCPVANKTGLISKN